MRSHEAKEKFKLADKLYRAKQYEEALRVLDELDVAYPETRQVMFPRARCLAKLDRTTEAMYLLREVVEKHEYQPAEELLNYLSVLQTTPLDTDAPPPPPEPHDGGLGEPQAEASDDSPVSATYDDDSPYAPMPVPGAAAKPKAGAVDPLDQLDLTTGAQIPGVDAAPEVGLLDQIHGGAGVDTSIDAMAEIDPATAPIDEDLFARGGSTEPKPAPPNTGRDINWTLIIGIAVIVLLVIGLGIFAAMSPAPVSEESQIAQGEQPTEQQQQQPAQQPEQPTEEAQATPIQTNPDSESYIALERRMYEGSYPGKDTGELIIPDQQWRAPEVLAWMQDQEDWTEERWAEFENQLNNMRRGPLTQYEESISRAYSWEWEQIAEWEEANRNIAAEAATDIGVGLGVGIGALIIGIVISIVVWTILCLLWQPIPIYLTLVVRDKMPSDDFVHNAAQVVFCCVIMGVLMGVLRLGYFIGMAAIGRQFDWEAMDYLIYVAFSIAMAGVYVAIILSMLPPELWEIMQDSPTGF